MDAVTGATIVAAGSGLNCSNISSSSSNSSSSGYASGHSSASTPATPMSSHYDGTTHVASAAAAANISEHVPTATVAPVTPFYSESALAQQQRQQYYQSYAYPSAATQYGPVYDTYTGNSYHNLTAPSIERSINNTGSSSSQQRLPKASKNMAAHAHGPTATSQQYSSVGPSVTTTTAATTKPQATATPFFAQPSASVNSSATTYYDPYGKYKMPSASKLQSQASADYAASYTNHFQHAAAAAASLSYQQQQQHYYAAKSQLQDVNYVAAAAAAGVKSHRQHVANASAAYYGGSNAYYDKYEKYMYAPTASSGGYGTTSASHSVQPHAPQPHPYSPHEPTSADPYRKAAAAAAANAWHWKMEYAAAAGNCHTLPPTATGSSYLSTPAATVSARDPFCAITPEKYSKYDKYSAYYASHHHPQQYMPTPTQSGVSNSSATARNLWATTTHHTPHLASVPPVISDRLTHALPPSAAQHQYPHTHPHATHHPFATASTQSAQRQSCCAQPFQQQSCYYPRTTQQYPHVASAGATNAYATQQQGHCNTANNHKYSGYGNNFKSSSSNDLYLTSPFETAPPAYNYAAASTTAMQQRYASASAAAYYTDLNAQSAFESYANNSLSQAPAMLQPNVAGTAHNVATHLSYQTPGTNQGSDSTAALLDYRKPSAAAATDCCMNTSRVALTNLEHVEAAAGYLNYDLHGNPITQAHAVITSPTLYSDGGSSSEKSTPTTKNLNLRDFISNWNEEEEEDLSGATEQLAYIEATQTNIENVNYPGSTGGEPISVQQPISGQHPQQQVPETEFPYKGAYAATRTPKIQVGVAVDGPSMDVEASQYVNLPDIVIDIEKSGGVVPGNQESTATAVESTCTAAPNSPTHHHHHHSSCGGHDFETFDVEKELDELQIKHAKLCLEKQLNNEIRILTPEPVVPQIHEEAQVLQQIEMPAESIIESIVKSTEPLPYSNTIAVQHNDCEKSLENAEHFFKDSELNDTASHSSNSSTFEKEYETFINRIEIDKTDVEREQIMRKNSETTTTSQPLISNEDSTSVSHQSSDIKTPPNPIERDEMTEEESNQNLQDFTMFYKKKRKLLQDSKENELTQTPAKQPKSDDESLGVEILKEKVIEKTCDNLKNIKEKYRRKCAMSKKTFKARRRPVSRFYKMLRRSISARSQIKKSTLLQRQIARSRERHLPLIKRQSFKNFSTSNKSLFNPFSLKRLTVSIVNTNAFQAQLMKDYERETTELTQKNCSKDELKIEDCEHQVQNKEEKKEKTYSDNENTNCSVSNSLEAPNSTTNSDNCSSSLKDQADFKGFEEQLKSARNTPISFDVTTKNFTEMEATERVLEKLEEFEVQEKIQVELTELKESDVLETEKKQPKKLVEENKNVEVEEEVEKKTDLNSGLEVNNFENTTTENQTKESSMSEDVQCREESIECSHETAPPEQNIEEIVVSQVERSIIETLVENVEKVQEEIEDKTVHNSSEHVESNSTSKTLVEECQKETEKKTKEKEEDVKEISQPVEVEKTCKSITVVEEKLPDHHTSKNLAEQHVFDSPKSPLKKIIKIEEPDCVSISSTDSLESVEAPINENPNPIDLLPTTSLQIYKHVDQLAVPVMRTKASVKICDFDSARLSSNTPKISSKSPSPTSMKSPKNLKHIEIPDINRISNEQKPYFDGIKNIDRTKFVESWAASLDLSATSNFELSKTEVVTSNPLQRAPSVESMPEALDLSPSSRFLNKTTPIPLEENSNSSTSTSSSSSSSDTTSSEHKSSSSSSTTNTSKSSSTSSSAQSSSSDNSTDGSDFNELKALEREISQHKTSAEWAQTIESTKGNHKALNSIDAYKTDTDNIENPENAATNQDIADLKRILESEQDVTEDIKLEQAAAECVVVKVEKIDDYEDGGEYNVCGVDNTGSQHTGIEKILSGDEAFEIKKNAKRKGGENEEPKKKTEEKSKSKKEKEKEKDKQHKQQIVIPKLSDLCKIALNSSFVNNELNVNRNKTYIVEMPLKESTPPIISPKSPISPLSPTTSQAQVRNSPTATTNQPASSVIDETTPPRELSVEEALAEMYRQAGVTSDPEDNGDNGLNSNDNGENQAQDYLLINLAEILENSDNESNVFVLQCDMNENILRVVTTSPHQVANSDEMSTGDVASGSSSGVRSGGVDRVSAVQLVQILNASELDIISDNGNDAAATAQRSENIGNRVDTIDESNSSSYIDLPYIHHEEIVPDNYKKFEKEQFLKYLHEKYVQQHVNRFYHANRILKKYRRYSVRKVSNNSARL